MNEDNYELMDRVTTFDSEGDFVKNIVPCCLKDVKELIGCDIPWMPHGTHKVDDRWDEGVYELFLVSAFGQVRQLCTLPLAGHKVLFGCLLNVMAR